MKNRPDISICMTTYNLENYIEEAIDSALNQQTDFTFEIVISDDCSTDKTQEILLKYKDQYPKLFKLIFNEENIKYSQNYIQTLKNCNGRYIAILDGDDVWTDRRKLQKQVEFMENNPEFSLTHHNGKFLVNGITQKNFNIKQKLPEYMLNELLQDANIWNSSVVYRNIYDGQFPEWFTSKKVPSYPIYPDYPLHVYHALKGKIKYFDECMGYYRIHNSNISQNINKIKHSQNSIWITNNLKKMVPKKYNSMLNHTITSHFEIIAGLYLKENNYLHCFIYVILSLIKVPFRNRRGYADLYYYVFKQ